MLIKKCGKNGFLFKLDQKIKVSNMKVVILAGGFGTRISEETNLIPKPMIKIGSKPILWHIMKTYSAQGFNEFIICCGYKSEAIKEFFANYAFNMSDVTIDTGTQQTVVHRKPLENWVVTLVETGEKSMTGGRLRRISKYLRDEKAFFLTYGDGLSDINITETLNFHNTHGKWATIAAVKPPGRFGILNIHGSEVTSFAEKPSGAEGYINGGYFVLSPRCLDLIPSDDTPWEKEPLEQLAQTGNLMAFKHDGFWQSMDTVRDKTLLENLWENGNAPWKMW